MTEETTWLTACAAAQHQAMPMLAPDTSGTTIRARLLSGLSGDALRVVMAERYGDRRVRYARVVCTVDGVTRTVLFDGDAAVEVAPGETVFSDPVDLPVRRGAAVDVWLYNDGGASSMSTCLLEQTHSEPGDHCGQDFAPVPIGMTMPDGSEVEEELASVVGLQVRAPRSSDRATIVAFGDSITKMGHWVGPLRDRIHAVAAERTLVNCGIGGNRLLRDTNFPMVPGLQMYGLSGLSRMRWDLLDLPGIGAVILALGINDISQPGAGPWSPPAEERCTLDQLISGYRRFIAAAREAGIAVVGCTITPFGGYESFDEETEALRRRANAWILESGEFDAVVDFASAIADPDRPAFMAPAYDSGDHLHPGVAGGAAMADAVAIDRLLELAR